LEILRLTPSSVNIQPWHFLIAESTEAKQRIAKAMTGRYAYNAPKVLDSSHTIVFCTLIDATPEHLEQLLEQDDLNGRFKDEKAKQGQRETRAGYVDFYRNEQKICLAGWKIKLLLLSASYSSQRDSKALMQHQWVVLMKMC
jgi:nitroreductase/dihydropteridine reductase